MMLFDNINNQRNAERNWRTFGGAGMIIRASGPTPNRHLECSKSCNGITRSDFLAPNQLLIPMIHFFRIESLTNMYIM